MLLVFNLDFTLWDAGGTWCDHTDPPYTKENSFIQDASGKTISLYPEVSSLGVHSFLVSTGLNWNNLKEIPDLD